jgi:hypothetical protein
VLVIAERMVDLAVPLHHTWTYQALLHDLLDMRANRVKVVVRQNDGNLVKHVSRHVVFRGSAGVDALNACADEFFGCCV